MVNGTFHVCRWQPTQAMVPASSLSASVFAQRRARNASDWWRSEKDQGKNKKMQGEQSRPFSPSRLPLCANWARETSGYEAAMVACSRLQDSGGQRIEKKMRKTAWGLRKDAHFFRSSSPSERLVQATTMDEIEIKKVIFSTIPGKRWRGLWQS